MVSRLRHLITDEYKLTIYEEMPGFGDLYDRKNDPNELNNLWENPEYGGIKAQANKEITI